jgi:hypothetical protein
MRSTPAVLATAAASKKPLPLEGWERASAVFIFVAGVLLVAGVIVWFGISTGDWKLVSKTTSGTGATATTTDYSDSIVIFAIATGAALMLAGAFYARLREIRLGPVTVGFGTELPEAKRAAVSKQVRQRIDARVEDPQMREILMPAAELLALEQARTQYVTTLATVSDTQLANVAQASADRVIAAADPSTALVAGGGNGATV